MFPLLDITNRDAIELSRLAPTRRIDRHQNRPCDACAHNTYEDQGSQKAKKQVRVERLMVQHPLVRDNPHGVDPVPVRTVLTWRTIFLWHSSQESSWVVDVWKPLSNENESDDEQHCCESSRDKSCSYCAERGRALNDIRPNFFIIDG